MAGVADALTAARALLGLALIPVAWALALGPAAILLATAWVTDLVDGRVARRAGPGLTRLGRWDFAIDTMVGASLLVGLTGAGVVEPWMGLGALTVFGGLYLAGNVAAAMLCQLSGYLPLLWLLIQHRPPGWWAPFLVAGVTAIVDWRRLLYVSIPAFLRGMAGRFERRLG